MYYFLHHAKGALVVSANSRGEVAQWSKRQLGANSGQVSIVEAEALDVMNMVERSGTGLQPEASYGCRPVMSLTADHTEFLSESSTEEQEVPAGFGQQAITTRQHVWH